MDKCNKWNEWNEEDYEYGYLTEKCECGEPVWLKGDKCNICRGHLSIDDSTRCPACGCLFHISEKGNICYKCDVLDFRGIKSKNGNECVYCECFSYVTSPGEISICDGCMIEPLYPIVKPAK